MAANFDAALRHLLNDEGGFVDHPRDPGGMTNLGVTRRAWQEWARHPVGEKEMRSLTVEDVAPMYRRKYWDAAGCDSLPSGLDYAVFDFAVNAGPGRAIKTLQSAVGAVQDGVLGPKTLAAISAVGTAATIERFAQERERFYRSLLTFDVFGNGWLARNDRVESIAKGMA